MHSVVIILASLLFLRGFLPELPSAEAQIGVIPEDGNHGEFSEVTLKLIGRECEIKLVKKTLNDVEGVIEVDGETKPRHVIIYYLPSKVTEQDLKNLIGTKNEGCYTSVVPPGVQNGNPAGTVGEFNGTPAENIR